MAKVPRGVKILPKISIAWVGRTNVTDRQTTDRQTTDGRTTTYSEHELEFTFAKKSILQVVYNQPLAAKHDPYIFSEFWPLRLQWQQSAPAFWVLESPLKITQGIRQSAVRISNDLSAWRCALTQLKCRTILHAICSYCDTIKPTQNGIWRTPSIQTCNVMRYANVLMIIFISSNTGKKQQNNF